MITSQMLDELQAACDAATPAEWQVGHTGTTTLEEAAQYMAETIAKRDSADLWMVFVGDPEQEVICPAYTGNGPTSEANAHYIVAAQPANVSRLITEIRRQRNEINRLTRLLEKRNV